MPRELRGVASRLACLLLAFAGCTRADPAVAQQRAAPPGAPSVAAIRSGVTRTDAEIARCRDEEAARFARRERPPLVPGEPVRLRAGGVQLGRDGCVAAAHRFNFFHMDHGTGCFVNAFARSGDTVADEATGLVWQWLPRAEDLTFAEAERYVEDLNARRVGGYSDWRLPTTEELFSLVETVEYDASRLDPSLFSRANELWTSDRYAPDRAHWVVDALLGGCRPARGAARLAVQAVRSARAER